MEKGIKNTFIGLTGTIAIAFFGGWVQLSSRISILEVQISNNYKLYEDEQEVMKEIKAKLDEINVKVTHLNDIKEDRDFVKGK